MLISSDALTFYDWLDNAIHDVLVFTTQSASCLEQLQLSNYGVIYQQIVSDAQLSSYNTIRRFYWDCLFD